MTTLDIIAEVLAEEKGQPVNLLREELKQTLLPQMKDRGAGLLREISGEKAQQLRAICRAERAGIMRLFIEGAGEPSEAPGQN